MLRRMMVAGLKNTSIATNPINIKIDNSSGSGTLAGWNWWNDNSSMVLKDSAGVNTTVKLSSSGASWDREAAPSGITGNTDFPSGVFDWVVYTFGGSSNPRNLQLTGLDSAKSYRIIIAAAYGYDDPTSDNKTNFTVGGVAKTNLMSTANQIYQDADFTVVNPVSGIVDIELRPFSGATYGMICGIKIIPL